MPDRDWPELAPWCRLRAEAVTRRLTDREFESWGYVNRCVGGAIGFACGISATILWRFLAGN